MYGCLDVSLTGLSSLHKEPAAIVNTPRPRKADHADEYASSDERSSRDRGTRGETSTNGLDERGNGS